MSDANGGPDWMKKNLDELIGQLELDDRQKLFLRSRWLDQVLWMERKAVRTQFRYYALRITAIVGGVMVPALVGLNFDDQSYNIVRGVTFVLGLVVAVSVAVEEFFHYGERWRHYRSTVEMLKSEGWQFFQLSGRYKRFSSHSGAYREFANQVELVLSAEVIKFINEVVVEKSKSTGKKEEPNAVDRSGKIAGVDTAATGAQADSGQDAGADKSADTKAVT